MKAPSPKITAAKEYREKYGNEMPTAKLARIMFKENKILFKDIEDARFTLRYIEGKAGERLRNATTVNVLPKRSPAPYNLPKSDESAYEPYLIKGSKDGRKIGILFDVHAPYHSVNALAAAIGYLKKEKIDLLILGGDFYDFHGLSKFLKDPRKRKFSEEINIGCDIMKVLHKELKCKIIYKLGNHCERLQHFLWQKWGELDQLTDLEEIKSITLENIVKKRIGSIPIDFVDDKRIIKANE